MKKLFGILSACLLVAGAASADVYTLTVTVTNNQPATFSDPLPISGYLDKVEYIQGGADGLSTSSVALATWSGETAVDMYVTNTAATVAKVFRPRTLGTGTSGTALAAVTANSDNTPTNGLVATTILKAKYEKYAIGSNVKLMYAGAPTEIVGTMTNTCRIFTTSDK